jgi:polar amino acid transport system substrate-binding protein
MPSDKDSDDARRELAASGSIRAAINTGNPVLARRDPDGGDPTGVSVDIAREVGNRLGVPVRLVAYAAAGDVTDGVDRDEWDLAFLAIDPQRAQRIAFTQPYLEIEGTYVVRAASPFQSAADLDQAGVTIAVGANAAYDLFLSRTLQHATVVREKSSGDALARFDREAATASAGVRKALDAFARGRSDLRVLADRFMLIEQAMAVDKQKTRAAAYLREFIADAIASGVIAAAIRRHA